MRLVHAFDNDEHGFGITLRLTGVAFAILMSLIPSTSPEFTQFRFMRVNPIFVTFTVCVVNVNKNFIVFFKEPVPIIQFMTLRNSGALPETAHRSDRTD